MNEIKPVITVITATYNADSYLNDFLINISSLKKEYVEFIVVDGGSSDHTLEIINDHISAIDCFVCEPDRGIYDAWNKGIVKARGEWIMFLGADDRLLSGSLENYLRFIKSKNRENTDVISAYNVYVDSCGVKLKQLGGKWSWAKMRRGMCIAHVGALHNRKLFEDVGLYNIKYKICGDYELLLRKRENLKVDFLNSRIAQMLVGGVSLSIKAVIETFCIRYRHRTVSIISNGFLFFRDSVAYYFFRLRNRV
jgi:glycosyltransferase involved in cell wall biosynthesis